MNLSGPQAGYRPKGFKQGTYDYVLIITRLWRAAGWVFAGGGALTLVLLVFYAAFYRVRLDYRFEVTAILITWLVLIAAPAFLSIAFLRREPVTDQRSEPVNSLS